MILFIILKKIFKHKGGANEDSTWRFLYPSMFIATVCSVVGLFTPYWFSDELCSDRGLVYECCEQPHNETTCHPAAWLSEEHISGFMLAALVLALLSVVGAVGGTVATVVIFVKDIEKHSITTRPVIFVGFASGSLMIASCLLVLEELGHYSLGTSFYICLVCGSFQVVPIVGFIFSKQLVGF